MRNSHTSKQTRKRSTHTICRILWNFFIINKQNALRCTIKECNTKLSTRPNTYDEEHRNTNMTPTAPKLPALPQNLPLSLFSRNFRNLAITKPPNFRPNTAQSPIQHIITKHPKNDDTYEQIIEQPHTTTF